MNDTAEAASGRRPLLIACAVVGAAGLLLAIVGPVMAGILLAGAASATAVFSSRGGSEIRRGNMTRLGILLVLLTIDLLVACWILGSAHDPATISGHNAWSLRGQHPTFAIWIWANLIAFVVIAMSFINSSTGFRVRRGRSN